MMHERSDNQRVDWFSFSEDRMGFQCHLCIQHCICECLNRIKKISNGISSRDEQTAKETRLINLTSLVFGNGEPLLPKSFSQVLCKQCVHAWLTLIPIVLFFFLFF